MRNCCGDSIDREHLFRDPCLGGDGVPRGPCPHYLRGQPHPPRIRTITLDSKERIGQLVDSYEFDRIVYFSEYLTPHSEQEGELDRLRRVLQANRERPSQLLYLAGPEAVLTPFIGKSVLAQAARIQ